MDELISRQAVEVLIMETDPWWCEGMTRAILEGVKELPTIESKTGKWIVRKDALGREHTVCDNCETEIKWRDSHGILLQVDMRNAKFCPNCGAYMRGE